jgi:hypothetical protein
VKAARIACARWPQALFNNIRRIWEIGEISVPKVFQVFHLHSPAWNMEHHEATIFRGQN